MTELACLQPTTATARSTWTRHPASLTADLVSMLRTRQQYYYQTVTHSYKQDRVSGVLGAQWPHASGQPSFACAWPSPAWQPGASGTPCPQTWSRRSWLPAVHRVVSAEMSRAGAGMLLQLQQSAASQEQQPQ